MVIFSDEKTFTVNPVKNCQNDYWYIRQEEDRDAEMGSKYITAPKHPASVMMWGVVASIDELCVHQWGSRLVTAWQPPTTSKCWLPKSSRGPTRLWATTTTYFSRILPPLKPARSPKSGCWERELLAEVNTPLPDTYPLDYSIWVHMEGKICNFHFANVAGQKAAASKERKKMSKENRKSVCLVFWPRFLKIVHASGAIKA